MTCGVYVIHNTVTDKRYVGSSVNIPLRWKIHLNDLKGGRHHSRHLQASWDKYGADAFEFKVVLDLGEPALDNLLECEQIILNHFKAADPKFGYNVSAVAGSRFGVPHSEDVRQKMRDAAKNRKPMSDETRKLLSDIVKARIAEGKHFTEEHRARISESLKGRPMSERARQALLEANKGRPLSEETKEKLRAANKGRPLSPENYARLMERFKTTNIMTPEIRAKQMKSRKETLRQARAAVAPLIVAMRDEQGMGYERIAKKLTADGVPTLRQRGNGKTPVSGDWHACIVRTIYLEAKAQGETL